MRMRQGFKPPRRLLVVQARLNKPDAREGKGTRVGGEKRHTNRETWIYINEKPSSRHYKGSQKIVN